MTILGYLTVVNVQLRTAQAVMDADHQKAQEALQKAQQLNQEGLDAVRQSVAALFIAEGTVKNHVTDILGKLDVRDGTEAAIKAREMGFI